MKLTKFIAASAATLAILAPLAIAHAQGQEKINPKSKTQIPPIISVSVHTPIPAYLIEKDRKCNEAEQRGASLFKSGDLDGAATAYGDALTYEQDDGTAYLGLASVYEAKGQLDKAADAYRKVFYAWPGKTTGSSVEGDTRNLMRFALVLLKVNQREEALNVYKRGVQYLPTDEGPQMPVFASADFNTAQFEAAIYTAMGLKQHLADSDQTKAAGCLQQAIDLDANQPQAHFYLGLVDKERRGFATESLAEFDKASHLGGAEMKPFVEKQLKDAHSSLEFTRAVKKAGLAGQ